VAAAATADVLLLFGFLNLVLKNPSEENGYKTVGVSLFILCLRLN
jgi:hypothetical protein